MAAQNSPFVEGTYGWPYGSSGWNTEMDLNLVKFSYLHDRNIDAIVSSLPAIVDGKAYFNTADNRLYFDANGQRYSSVTPKWFEVTLRTTGEVYQFDGAALNLVPNSVDYTDELRDELADTVAPENGAALVGWKRSALSTAISSAKEMLNAQPVSIWEFAGFVTSKPNPSDPSTWDWTPAFNAANTYAGLQPNPIDITVTRKLGVASTVKITARYATLNCKNGTILALSGFTSETAVVQFGDNAGGFVWSGYGSHLHVDCNYQRLIAVDFNRPLTGAFYSSVRTERSKFRGIQVSTGFGLKIDKYDIRMPMILDGGAPTNADVDSIGLYVLTTDCDFGSGDVAGAGVGVKVIGGNNTFGPVHAWGVYQKAGIPQSTPMLAGVWNEGQSNTFMGCIADSPSLIDYSLAASITNGGYGFVNRANGFQAQFFGCKTFIPNRAPFGETLPVAKIVGHLCNQGAQYFGCEMDDSSGGGARVSGFNGLYAGTNVANCPIFSRDVNRIGSVLQTQFITKPYFSKGVELQVQFQNADQQSASFGACSFAMPDQAHFNIVTNFNGGVVTTRIPRQQRGTTAFRTGSVQPLLTVADSGYLYWDTDLAKPVFWTGTGWVAPTVTAV